MTLHIFCDQCSSWVHEITMGTSGLYCICGNLILLEKDTNTKMEKNLRIQIARAIWNL